MHEPGMANSIAAIVAEQARGCPVKTVRLAIGPRACVEREALAFR